MEYKRIELDRILQEGADAELYVFTFRPDLTELAASINMAGLLVAPVLQEDEGGVCRIVCGWSRIQVLRQLGPGRKTLTDHGTDEENNRKRRSEAA